jgi:integrase/recombinase XerD
MARQTILANGKLDIHDLPTRLASQERILKADSAITERNKEFIRRFIHDCDLGKTLLDRQKKKVGLARLVKYLIHLRSLAKWLARDFDEVTQQEMEDFVLSLERNQVRKSSGDAYSETVKRDYKICLRKFYRWLLGKNEFYPEIVRWLDTREVVKEIPTFRIDKVERMGEYATNLRDKAMIWVLFDTGARAEEFLNLRQRNLEEVESPNGEKVYRVRIEFSKTKPRTVMLPLATPALRLHLESLGATQPDDRLFDYAYRNLLKTLHLIGMRSIKRKVHPHLLRHCSATYYATRLNRGAFCNRFGWSYRSNMADRYVDREALTDEETVQVVETESLGNLRKENNRLREDLSQVQNQLGQVHELLSAITTDPVITRHLARAAKVKGQGDRLREMRIDFS